MLAVEIQQGELVIFLGVSRADCIEDSGEIFLIVLFVALSSLTAWGSDSFDFAEL